ncbi:MAG: hypothetical protein AB7L13_13420 [Acidimicrobiia bacterium]
MRTRRWIAAVMVAAGVVLGVAVAGAPDFSKDAPISVEQPAASAAPTVSSGGGR